MSAQRHRPTYLYVEVSNEMPNQKLIGNFVALPESTLDSEQWKCFTASTRCVYTIMLRKYWHSGPKANGRVKWRQDELSQAAGVSLKTIKRSLNDLRDKDWITVWEPGGRWLDGTTYTMNPKWANGKEC